MSEEMREELIQLMREEEADRTAYEQEHGHDIFAEPTIQERRAEQQRDAEARHQDRLAFRERFNEFFLYYDEPCNWPFDK